MEISGQAMTPEKASQSQSNAENLNPNVQNSSMKSPKEPVVVVVHSPQNRIRQRKFVVAKKKKTDAGKAVSCKCKYNGTAKCLCVAYQNLRASQEEFFSKNSDNKEKGYDEEDEEQKAESLLDEVIEARLMIQDLDNEGRKIMDEEREEEEEEEEDNGDAIEGSSMVKRRRDRLLEEARNSVPENGSGRVMHLVKAFEKLLSLHKNSYKEKDEKEEEKQHHDHDHDGGNSKNKVMKWALPGLQLQQPPKASETEVSGSGSSLFCCTSELVLTSENLGLDKRDSVSSSWDSSRGSVSSRTSGGRRSRRNSLESSGTFGEKRWKKKQQLKVTSQKPFKLRTEQRGKLKEEEFTKKVQEMMTEEEKLRIPIAQGLPWTTDEPECLLKPPVKESTKPIDLKLHSDVRAIDRAEFDQQVAEKMSLIEQQKFEMERQNKMAEEEEIRRLRKALIPKAQPMPYFDRPFVPRRSMKHPTIPREPKFHIPHHKKIKCCLSWNDMSPYSSYLN